MDDNATATPTRARNRRGEGARLRADIVAAAVDLLDETGDEKAVTLRAVARKVGIAAPSIYRHFPDQPSIMLAVVRQAFAELEERLTAALASAGDGPRRRMFALGGAYLEFAQQHPGPYRIMFGGLWMPDLTQTSMTVDELVGLGDATMGLLVDVLGECVAAGISTSDDPAADAVALWLGLHGFAHQRAVTVAYPWPSDLAERMITALAHLTG